jgi:hypothetical protein
MHHVNAKEEDVKVPSNDLSCWEIMQCKGTEDCPARLHPEKPCWEIARELDDYRSALKICQDCIVFLLKNGNIVLSDQEVRAIMKRKGSCALG